MNLGISKDNLPAMARSFCTLISGAGAGMFLAVAFVAKDDRSIFHFSYYLTAWLLALGGGLLRDVIDSVHARKAGKDSIDEKHLA